MVTGVTEIPRPPQAGTPFEKGDGRPRFTERSGFSRMLMPALRAFLRLRRMPRNEAGDFSQHIHFPEE
jgi:hypothetical protein